MSRVCAQCAVSIPCVSHMCVRLSVWISFARGPACASPIYYTIIIEVIVRASAGEPSTRFSRRNRSSAAIFKQYSTCAVCTTTHLIISVFRSNETGIEWPRDASPSSSASCVFARRSSEQSNSRKSGVFLFALSGCKRDYVMTRRSCDIVVVVAL